MRTLTTLFFITFFSLAVSAQTPFLDGLKTSWNEFKKADLQFYPVPQTTPTKSVDHGKVKVVIFWASWCEFCKAELQMMSRYKKNFPNAELNIIAVNVDTQPQLGNEVAKLYQDDMIFVHDKNSQYKKKMQISKIPLTLIYESNGEFHSAYSGFSNERFSSIRKRISSLLKYGDGEN